MAGQSVHGPDWMQTVSLAAGTPLSGQVTGVGIGTAVQGSNVALGNGVFIKALPANVGTVWVGNIGGSVAGTTGYPLLANEQILLQVTNLNQLYFDAPTTDKVAWLKA